MYVVREQLQRPSKQTSRRPFWSPRSSFCSSFSSPFWSTALVNGSQYNLYGSVLITNTSELNWQDMLWTVCEVSSAKKSTVGNYAGRLVPTGNGNVCKSRNATRAKAPTWLNPTALNRSSLNRRTARSMATPTRPTIRLWTQRGKIRIFHRQTTNLTRGTIRPAGSRPGTISRETPPQLATAQSWALPRFLTC